MKEERNIAARWRKMKGDEEGEEGEVKEDETRKEYSGEVAENEGR
jgi:hypothetical protein